MLREPSESRSCAGFFILALTRHTHTLVQHVLALSIYDGLVQSRDSLLNLLLGGGGALLERTKQALGEVLGHIADCSGKRGRGRVSSRLGSSA